MLTIILKIILCSSLFIAVYYLFLEKEKMYRFNRFYLVFSLALSYLIPFISITIQLPKPKNTSQAIFESTAQQIILTQHERESFNWMILVWLIYGSVTLFFLIRSILAIRAIRKIQGEKCIYQNHNIVVTKEKFPPFSFWNTIYLGPDYIKNKVIDPRIFLHEKSHLDQKHSIDIIFMDLLKIFTWFNPFLFLYKKAMVTNHEFLADETILKSRFDVKEYQNLILEEIINRQNLPFTHSFNFNNTKKRFIMMTAKKSKFIVLKKVAGITALITAAALFAERTYTVDPLQKHVITKTGNLPKVHLNKANQNSKTAKNTQPYQVNLIPKNYFEKKTDEEIHPAMGMKKEIVKTDADTISPKKTNSNEGKNTNSNTNIDKNFTEAEYPGGSQALRKKIGLTMNTSLLESKKAGLSSVAYIHLDKTGKATEVTASGNDEAFTNELIRTAKIISKETVWKPATKDGKAIATIYKIPATMTFE